MKLLYRLGYYFVGFSVGLIFLTFIFSGKKTSCNYSPSARVKGNLEKKEIFISQELRNKYPFLDESLIKNYIRNGKIDFSRSNVKLDSCKTYFFNLSKKNILNFEVINCSKIIELKNITPN